MKGRRSSATLEALVACIDQQILDWRAGGVTPSIAEAARAVGISRQAVYATYPEVVSRVSNAKASRGNQSSSATLTENLLLRKRIASESEKVKVLSTLVVELMAELCLTKEDMDVEISRLKRQLEIAHSQTPAAQLSVGRAKR